MIIAVDFDGTIVEHNYPKIGKPIPFAIDVLKRLQVEQHHQLILWSVREGELLDEAVEYCAKQGLEFYAVNKNYPEEELDSNCPRKLNADLFIDDRNIGGLPDWGTIYQAIKNKKQDQPLTDLTPEEYKSKKKRGFFSFGK
ncbi:MAG: hypothetical protein R3Y59_10630 [bacterium]